MRHAILIVTALSLGGCDMLPTGENNAIKACEGFIGKGLRSPSTYKRIEAVAAPHAPGKAFRYVSIEYDAANAYGTPIRGNQTCAFKVDPQTGDFPSAALMDMSASLADSEKTLRELKGLTGDGDEESIGAFDCCVADGDRAAAAEAF